MRFLIDTHIFLWHIDGNPKLNQNVAAVIEDPENNIYLSIGSIWEITLKVSKGKLPGHHSILNLKEYLAKSKFEILQISFSHLEQIEILKSIHGDPFDRLIVAQAISEKLVLITDDEVMKQYPADFLK